MWFFCHGDTQVVTFISLSSWVTPVIRSPGFRIQSNHSKLSSTQVTPSAKHRLHAKHLELTDVYWTFQTFRAWNFLKANFPKDAPLPLVCKFRISSFLLEDYCSLFRVSQIVFTNSNFDLNNSWEVFLKLFQHHGVNLYWKIQNTYP